MIQKPHIYTTEATKAEKANWEFAVTLPVHDDEINKIMIKGSQFQKPYLKFIGACEGFGELPCVEIMTQLFGEQLIIETAAGCTSIWRTSNPSVPYTVNSNGEDPACANSLFEENAEFGFGMLRAFQQRSICPTLLLRLILREQLTNADPTVRCKATQDIEKLWPAADGIEAAVPNLAGALKYGSPDVRQKARERKLVEELVNV